MSLVEILTKFSWVFDEIPLGDFVIFGVIREPVDYLASLYRFHAGPDFVDRDVSSHSEEQSNYILKLMRSGSWMLEPQIDRFKDSSGAVAVNYLIDFAQLNEQIGQVLECILGSSSPLSKLNSSTIGSATFSECARRKIVARYGEDEIAYRKLTGHWLRPPANNMREVRGEIIRLILRKAGQPTQNRTHPKTWVPWLRSTVRRMGHGRLG